MQNPSSLPDSKLSIGANGSTWLPPASCVMTRLPVHEGELVERDQDNLESRSLRAKMLVSLGELSSARQDLVGAELAPRNQGALNALRDPTRRHVPEHHCRTDDTPYPQCVRIGMTTKHFRSLLDDVSCNPSVFPRGGSVVKGGGATFSGGDGEAGSHDSSSKTRRRSSWDRRR